MRMSCGTCLLARYFVRWLVTGFVAAAVVDSCGSVWGGGDDDDDEDDEDEDVEDEAPEPPASKRKAEDDKNEPNKRRS